MMREEPESGQRAYAIVDEALKSYSLSPAPPSLLPAVMRRVQASAVRPRLRPRLLDTIVSAFIALMVLCTALFWHLPAPDSMTGQAALSSPWLILCAAAAFFFLVFLSGLALSDRSGGF